MTAKSRAIKARGGKSGRCAAKAAGLYLGRSARCPEASGLSGSARAVSAAQKSAEGIVVGLPTKARTMDKGQ